MVLFYGVISFGIWWAFLLGYHLAGRGRFWGLIDNKEGIAITAKHRSLLALPAADDIFVKWYKSAVISSGDTIRAISEWYNHSIFDNISINMCNDEIEDYTTNNGMCFGKVSTNFLI